MNETPQATEAVFFLEGDKIAREMLFPEFEAILDGFVPMPASAGKKVKAVYLVINNQLKITAAVFFVLDFDDQGNVDARWNLPLTQLVEQAGRGPDLGGGPIRLVCFSQCPQAWLRTQLWDPSMQPDSNGFAQLRKAVEQNRLGLVVSGVPEPSPRKAESERHQDLAQRLHQHYSQAMRDRLAGMLKDQRLHIATLRNAQQRQLQALQRDHQQRLQAYRDKIRQLQAQQGELKTAYETLCEDHRAQAQKIEVMRDYYSNKIRAAQQDETQQLLAMEEHYQGELNRRLEEVQSELKERLDMREMELFYRHQQESQLKKEIVQLRQENQNLLKQGGGQLLERLTQAGISFVCFHPGVGQLTVPVEDMSVYLSDPEAFAARQLGLEADHYRAWLKHYKEPACQARTPSATLCGKALERVEQPTEFYPGESDCCSAHQFLDTKVAEH